MPIDNKIIFYTNATILLLNKTISTTKHRYTINTTQRHTGFEYLTLNISHQYLSLNTMAEEAEKLSKPKKTKKEKETPIAEPSIPFWRNERYHRIIGVLFIFLASLLAMSFTSFLFSYKSDWAEAHNFSFDVLQKKSNEPANLVGWLGAWLSFQFFVKGFGIASYLFLPVLFLLGVKLVFKNITIKVWKTIAHCFPAILFFSVALGLFTTLPFYSGAFGIFVSDWSQRLIGTIGTLIALLFFLITYLIIMFNLDFSKKPSLLNAKENTKTNLAGKLIFDNDSEVKEWEKAIQEENKEEFTKRKNEPINIDESELLPVEPFYVSPEITDDGFEIITKENPKNIPDLSLDIVPPVDEIYLPDENDITAEEVLSSEPYDPTLDLPHYKFPSIDLLNDYGSDTIKIDKDELERNKNQIVETLKNYNIDIAKIKATIGPTVTLYEIVPAPGVRISKIKNLEDDIALALSALGIRIIAPIPGKGTIGIEVPNANKETVSMKSLLTSEKFQQAKMDLPIALGKSIANEVFVADLAKMPHLLMAGATGQGKSVGINALLVSLLYKKHPAELKFVMVDPKKVELSLFKLIEKHFLAKLPGEEDPIITDTKKVIYTLNALCVEMDNRYNLLKEAGVRNIKEYNVKFIARRLNPLKGHEYLPYIVLVVDEFADLMMTAGKEVETPIARIAQLARAVGIHLVIATQRPSVNIITGVIKANFPARIAFKVSAVVDSRTILDAGGANQLIGRGDMLFSNGGDITRLQCGFVDTPEVEAIAEYIGKQQGYSEAFRLPEYEDEKGENLLGNLSEEDRDPMFEEAARIIVTSQVGSTSMLQRKLKLGYNRAGRLMDQLEQAGIVGPNVGSKPREVTYKDVAELEQLLRNL